MANGRFLMFALTVIGTAVTFPSSARAQKVEFSNVVGSDAYFTITEMETVEVTKKIVKKVDRLPIDRAEEQDPPTSTEPGPNGRGIDLGEIIKIGMDVWKIIESNKPVVSTTFQPGLAVLPEAAKKWEDLELWTVPQVRLFKTTYRNAFRMPVVEFTYRVIYSYNGTLGGKGKFLSRVEVEPANLSVAWGYKVSAAAEAVNPLNVGTRENPIASLEIRVNWTVETVLRHLSTSTRFYVRGDGLFKDITNGNIL